MSEAELTDLLRRSIAGEQRTPPPPPKRRDYIGSTASAPLVSLYRPDLADGVRWSTAADVYMAIKLGIEQRSTRPLERGKEVEPALRQLFRDTVGPVSEEPPEALRHSQFSFVGATPDGLCGDGALCSSDDVYEAKSWSGWQRKMFGAPGTDEVPVRLHWQAQHHMAVTGRSRVLFLVAFGFDDPTTGLWGYTETGLFVVGRDETLVSALLECSERFWTEFVLTGRPPPVDSAHNKRRWKSIRKAWYGK